MTSRVKGVFFDLDGTLVRYRDVEFESSWGAIGVAAGLKTAWDALLARYLGQPGSYGEWVRESAALLRGVMVSDVERGVFPPPYAEGVPQVVYRLRQMGYVVGIVSSGVSLVAERVREELAMDFALANELLVAEGRFTGEVYVHVPLEAKLLGVQRYADRHGLTLSELAFVGDHFNDIPVLEAVGCGIAYAPKTSQVAQAARHVAVEFSQVLHFLGVGTG